MLYSSNGGQSWTTAQTPPAGITGIKVSPSVVLATAGASVYRSTNGGQSFAADAAFTTAAAGNTAALRSVWVDAQGYGLVVGDNGSAYRITPATGSTTNTFLYTKIATDATPDDDKGTGLPVASFKNVQFSDRLTGYITAPNMVLKTVDGGAHWKAESAGAAATGTPQLALSSDAQRGTLVGADGSVKALNDQAEQFNSRFWYDELGRLVLSQNAKQFTIAATLDPAILADAVSTGNTGTLRGYSYTLYDEIGRISEVGELLTDKAVPLTPNKTETQVKYTAHTAFAAAAYKHQVSKTFYDLNETPPAGFEPQNLRNRVAYTTYQQERNSAPQQTHYSYDVHGNVNSLLQIITHDGNVLAKRVDYEYDLISGKVNKVYYQKDQPDQLIHAYAYDGDNRITEVKTSTDNRIFTKEASYEYYAHGPLARTKLGELGVETENYAYTVQGWIKQMQAQAFSYALGYNDTDYKSIGTGTTMLATPIATVNSKSQGLYNGNIASMTSQTPVIAAANLQQQYAYDQLNRIVASSTPGAANANAYSTAYSYDANGNIKTLARYDGEGAKFDELSYTYETKANNYLHTTNKLRAVYDAIGATLPTDDIENQSADNYSYDATGNLIADRQEEIANIEWTVSGKVKRVTRTAGSIKPDLEFEYDASGQRIVKKVIKKNGDILSTYYLRDASGNVMSVYSYNSASNAPLLSEQYIYGSSRLGVYNPTANVLSNGIGARSFGRKSYELSDHLGNVRATLSDYRRAASAATVNSATDYYPFGMVARSYSNSQIYRFGYNGKEHEDDLTSGDYDFGLRIFDSRLGRFLSIDPLFFNLPFISPYNYSANNPIYLVDKEGALPSPGMLAFRTALYQLKTLAKATDVSGKTKGVVSVSLGFSGKAGVAIAGAGIKYSIGIAADPYGNYAFTGTAGLFIDLFGGIGGWSYEDKNPSNGNFYFGGSAGFAGSVGYLPGFKHVRDLSGTTNEFDIDTPKGGGTIYSDPNLDPKGGSVGGGLPSAGMGFGNMQTTTNVYAFTDADLQQMQDAIETTENTYWDEKLDFFSDYTDVSFEKTIEVTDNAIKVTLMVTAVNSDGQKVTLSSKVALDMTKAADGYFKTKNVKEAPAAATTTQ